MAILAAWAQAAEAPLSTTQQSLSKSKAAWAEKDFAAVRTECGKIMGSPAAGHLRSYAHLRIAQSYVAEGQAAAAVAEYRKIAAAEDYPLVHRYEAEECAGELARVARGLPPRDPARSRLKLTPSPAPGREFFVAPDGDDGQPGTAQRPFATLGKARDAVREVLSRGPVPGGIAVTLKPGEYRLTQTLSLGAADSGRPDAPIVYRAQRKGEAILYGGARLAGFQPVTDEAILQRLPAEARGRVMQCDLKAQGVTNYGKLAVRGFGQPPSPPTVEVYVDGVPMTLARWPNDGFVRVKTLVAPGSAKDGTPSVIAYESDRPERWTTAPDAWIFGYFRFLWADGTLPIGKIDTAAKTLTTAQPYSWEGAAMDLRQGIYYYAFNLLEEIDRPGEWYLDRARGILYLYPPTDLAKATVEMGLLAAPIMQAKGVSHVRFEGLVLDLSRYDGIVLRDCSQCAVVGTTVKRLAGDGITIDGGRQDVILGCDVHTMGRRATEVVGGDRATLSPGGHVVENCRFYDFGRIDRTYTPGVQLEGVGNRVAHCYFHDCPSSAMRIEGNDHVIEFNVARHTVRESDDQGVMEMFGNPSYRGVVFRYNLLDRAGTEPYRGVAGVGGIRLDDAICGVLIYGNVFRQTSQAHFGAVQFNGGRDNIVDNNLIIECKKGITGNFSPANHFWRAVVQGRAPANFFDTELYRRRYPAMAPGLQALASTPGTNFIWRNVFYDCGKPMVKGNEAMENGVFNSDPGFVDLKSSLEIAADAPLFNSVGFRPIPVSEMGLYEDERRASRLASPKP